MRGFSMKKKINVTKLIVYYFILRHCDYMITNLKSSHFADLLSKKKILGVVFMEKIVHKFYYIFYLYIILTK